MLPCEDLFNVEILIIRSPILNGRSGLLGLCLCACSEWNKGIEAIGL